MKYSVAIVLLARQVLPASTEEAQSILSRKDKRRQRAERILATSARSNNAPPTMENAAAAASAKDRRHGTIDGLNLEEFAAKMFKTGAVLKNKSQKSQKQCDPKSDDLDVGILSCGGGRYCVESLGSPLGGQCMLLEPIRKSRSPFGAKLKNKKRSTKKACDPNAGQEGAADIGLLACGMGHYCKESEESLLGGFCASKVAIVEESNVARRTQDTNSTGNLFTPEYVCSVGNCDCEDFDFAAGNGTILCASNGISCQPCSDVCYSGTTKHNFVANAVASYKVCIYFIAPYERKACYSYENDADGTKVACEYSLDNQVCDLCSTGPDECGAFDCTNTNIPGAAAGDSCANEYPIPNFKDEDRSCASSLAGNYASIPSTIEGLCSGDYHIDCDCEDIDFTAGNGTIRCIIHDQLCEPCGDACLSRAGNFTFVANASASLSFCSYFTAPYERKICYSYEKDVNGTKAAGCEISHDDEVCNLCITGPYNCGSFDCTNTGIPGAAAGDSCASNEYSLPILKELLDISCLNDTATYEACYPSFYNYFFLTDKFCNCSNINPLTLTGSFSCNYFKPVCYGPEDTTCALMSSFYNISDDRSSVTDGVCINLFDPYERQFCYYESTALPENERFCSVDSVNCDSCTVNPISALCYEFDCTNTVAMTKGGVNADGTCDIIGPPFLRDLVNGLAQVVTASPVTTTGSVVTESPSASPTGSVMTESPSASPSDGAAVHFKSSQAVAFFAMTTATLVVAYISG